jgi:NAD(P)-dependent dehydrogenase (short-subunit alcohol dehydrogenase family)
MPPFAGKVAFVTGGGSGIGRATAIAFAREGAKVAVAGRRSDAGQETIRLVREAGSDGLFIQTDVRREADVRAAVERTVTAFGRLDFAFNNAGMFGETPDLTQQTEEEFDRVMSVNVKGVWLGMKYEIRQMLQNGGGSIVNNSSMLGKVGFAGAVICVASKHAVLGLTKAAALTYATDGIRVNAVCPGVIEETDMHNVGVGANEPLEKTMRSMHPVGRFGKPAEVASAVLWLCSKGAAFVNGQGLSVDGGYTVA